MWEDSQRVSSKDRLTENVGLYRWALRPQRFWRCVEMMDMCKLIFQTKWIEDHKRKGQYNTPPKVGQSILRRFE